MVQKKNRGTYQKFKLTYFESKIFSFICVTTYFAGVKAVAQAKGKGKANDSNAMSTNRDMRAGKSSNIIFDGVFTYYDMHNIFRSTYPTPLLSEPQWNNNSLRHYFIIICGAANTTPHFRVAE